MKTPLDSIQVTMPAPEVLYRLAKRAKDASKTLEDGLGAISPMDSMATRLNDMGNRYLLANEGR